MTEPCSDVGYAPQAIQATQPVGLHRRVIRSSFARRGARSGVAPVSFITQQWLHPQRDTAFDGNAGHFAHSAIHTSIGIGIEIALHGRCAAPPCVWMARGGGRAHARAPAPPQKFSPQNKAPWPLPPRAPRRAHRWQAARWCLAVSRHARRQATPADDNDQEGGVMINRLRRACPQNRTDRRFCIGHAQQRFRHTISIARPSLVESANSRSMLSSGGWRCGESVAQGCGRRSVHNGSEWVIRRMESVIAAADIPCLATRARHNGHPLLLKLFENALGVS